MTMRIETSHTSAVCPDHQWHQTESIEEDDSELPKSASAANHPATMLLFGQEEALRIGLEKGRGLTFQQSMELHTRKLKEEVLQSPLFNSLGRSSCLNLFLIYSTLEVAEDALQTAGVIKGEFEPLRRAHTLQEDLKMSSVQEISVKEIAPYSETMSYMTHLLALSEKESCLTVVHIFILYHLVLSADQPPTQSTGFFSFDADKKGLSENLNAMLNDFFQNYGFQFPQKTYLEEAQKALQTLLKISQSLKI